MIPALLRPSDEDCFETSSYEDYEQSSRVWPRWVLDAKLMRFPREDINFDESKPLGCGQYGFVYNGSIMYGFAR